MGISAIATGGLIAAESSFNKAEAEIARNASGAAPADTANLSSSAVASLSAKADYSADLGTIEVDAEMIKHMIDMLV